MRTAIAIPCRAGAMLAATAMLVPAFDSAYPAPVTAAMTSNDGNVGTRTASSRPAATTSMSSPTALWAPSRSAHAPPTVDARPVAPKNTPISTPSAGSEMPRSSSNTAPR